jgi:hypothetical protein
MGLDFAAEMKRLADVDSPGVERIRMLLDNLGTHTLASLYEAYPADEVWRLARRLGFHHTPKHGSWPRRSRACPAASASIAASRTRSSSLAKSQLEPLPATETASASRALHHRRRPVKLKHPYPPQPYARQANRSNGGLPAMSTGVLRREHEIPKRMSVNLSFDLVVPGFTA